MRDVADNNEEQIRSLLASLNLWEQNYGTTYGPKRGMGSTGEANARIAGLKEKLHALGALYHWDGSQYVLDGIAESGQGGQRPDKPEN